MLKTLGFQRVLGSLFCVFTALATANAQSNVTREQYFPQVVGGGDWDSTITIKNLSGSFGSVLVEFCAKDRNGTPITYVTSRGIGSSFQIDLKIPVATEKLVVLHQQPYQTGWVRIGSTIEFGASLFFQQYEGNNVVGSAGVDSSPIQQAFLVDLDPHNGIALVNPNQSDAKIDYWAWDEVGNDITSQICDKNSPDPKKDCSIELAHGEQLTRFFFEDPFNFGDRKGSIVFSSNVPLSVVALRIVGKNIATIPIQPAPKVPNATIKKVGVLVFEPSDRMPENVTQKTNIVAKAADLVFTTYQRRILDRYLPLHGYKTKQLPIDIDPDTKLPRVKFIRGEKIAQDYILPNKPGGDWFNDTIDLNAIVTEVNKLNLSAYSTVLVFVDTIFMCPYHSPTGFVAQASLSAPYYNYAGRAFVSTFLLPFLKEGCLTDPNSFLGKIAPELDGQKLPLLSMGMFGDTWKRGCDTALDLATHELTHALGVGNHSQVEAKDRDKYHSLMDISPSSTGMFRTDGTTQVFLMPSDAGLLSIAPALNQDYFPWVKLDGSDQRLKVLSKDISGGKLHIVVSSQKEQAGNRFIGIYSGDWPYVLYFRDLLNTDRGDLDITIPVTPTQISSGISVAIFNHQGWSQNPIGLSP